MAILCSSRILMLEISGMPSLFPEVNIKKECKIYAKAIIFKILTTVTGKHTFAGAISRLSLKHTCFFLSGKNVQNVLYIMFAQ